MSDIYSSGVSIMLRSMTTTSSTENFGLDKSSVGCSVSLGTVAPDTTRNSLSSTVPDSNDLNKEIVCADNADVWNITSVGGVCSSLEANATIHEASGTDV